MIHSISPCKEDWGLGSVSEYLATVHPWPANVWNVRYGMGKFVAAERVTARHTPLILPG